MTSYNLSSLPLRSSFLSHCLSSGRQRQTNTSVYRLWVPLGALYGIALFTFSVSSRRVIDSRLGVVDLRGPPIIPPTERKAAPAPLADQWTVSHHTVTIPALSRLSHARSADAYAPRTPLTVTFEQQRVVV